MSARRGAERGGRAPVPGGRGAVPAGVPGPGPVAVRLQVAVGGVLGALVRVGVVSALLATSVGPPWGVLTVNLLGALLLGVLVGRVPHAPRLARWAPLLGTGLAGSLTTFSALAVDLVALGRDRPWLALGYAAVSLGAGTALAALGLRLGRGDDARTAPGGRRGGGA